MAEHRKKPRRSGTDRRHDNDRRAEARLRERADRRKKSLPVATERRSGSDRRRTGRRQGSRRAAADRRT